MRVLKFGGTSLGSPARIKQVAQLINDNQPKIIVLSAMSGTTNELTRIASIRSHEEFVHSVRALQTKNEALIAQLTENATNWTKDGHFQDIFARILENYHIQDALQREKSIVAAGEQLSSWLFSRYCQDQLGMDCLLISALDFMRIDAHGRPDEHFLAHALKDTIGANREVPYFITQGFICRNPFGNIDNLKRGGSDYTASLIGKAISAERIEIWTDIDGMHNNDPRIVSNSTAIRKLSFAEAAELAYFGAKILHPSSVLPARQANIPVLLKNTLAPEQTGTLIEQGSQFQGVRAVAAKDNITSIKVESSRMLLAYGFLRELLQILKSTILPWTLSLPAKLRCL